MAVVLNGKMTWAAILISAATAGTGGYVLEAKIQDNEKQIAIERQDRMENKNDVDKRLDRIQESINELIRMHMRGK